MFQHSLMLAVAPKCVVVRGDSYVVRWDTSALSVFPLSTEVPGMKRKKSIPVPIPSGICNAVRSACVCHPVYCIITILAVDIL